MTAERPIFDPQRMAAREDASLAPRTMTVGQLNAMVKRALGASLPANILLLGQVSNLTRPGSGHLYFTLKDDRSEVRAVMWKSSAASLKFKVEDGLEVIATGSVDVYEPRGQYQFQVRKLEPKGVGNLELAFRQLHVKLSAEGLFEKARKRPIPRYPRRIGVVTSASGAAIHDILHTLGRRYPCLEVLLYPVRVQGDGAAREIADAIRILNERAADVGGLDVLIVGRGGGSLEDLWAFNEEIVARAIVASGIPIISGVGHEVDVTIADLVADVRAPTPTAAAELAVPVLAEVLDAVAKCEARFGRCMQHHLEMARSRLEAIQRVEVLRTPMAVVRRAEQQTDELAGGLHRAVEQAAARARRRLSEVEVRLARVRPGVLVRDQQARVTAADHRLNAAIQHWWRQTERRLDHAGRALLSASPSRAMATQAEKTRQFRVRLDRSVGYRLRTLQATIDALSSRLEATSYRRTLARGFSVTWDDRQQQIITRPADVQPGQAIVTETADGAIRSRVEP